MTRVLCIDPGMRGTGYAMFEGGSLSLFGCIRPSGDGDRAMDVHLGRVSWLADRLAVLFGDHEPEVAVIEITPGKAQSHRAAWAMAASWATVVACARTWGAEVVQVTPMAGKRALTGKARGVSKADMQAAAIRLHPVIRFEPIATREHIADAVALYYAALPKISHTYLQPDAQGAAL